MQEFSASLVREKITFADKSAGKATPASETVIRSNRIMLMLKAGEATEKVVVRAQTMPVTLRLASRVMFSFYRNGLFLPRETPYDWQQQWDSVLSGYDRDYHPDIWSAIYINGRPAFKTTTSPFVDVVEQCALLSIDNYDATMGVTADALKKIGRDIHIDHASSVAAVFADNGASLRVGIIHRAEGRDTTFSFTAEEGERDPRVVQGLGVASAFLEAANLVHVIRAMQGKIRRKEAARASPEATRLRTATARLTLIDKTVASFEEAHLVKYRPEKPDFFAKIQGGI